MDLSNVTPKEYAELILRASEGLAYDRYYFYNPATKGYCPNGAVYSYLGFDFTYLSYALSLLNFVRINKINPVVFGTVNQLAQECGSFAEVAEKLAKVEL